MRRAKKMVVWSGGALLVSLLLVVSLDFALSKLVSLDAAKAKAVEMIDRSIGCRADFDHLDVSIIPRPHITLRNPVLCRPERLQASVESVSMTPKVLPLLAGRLEIGALEIVGPRVAWRFSEDERSAERESPPPGEERSYPNSPLDNIKRDVVLLIAAAASTVPNLALTVRAGEVDCIAPDGRNLRFSDIDARIVFPPDAMKVSLSARSTLWEKLSLKGRLSPEDLRCDGDVKLEGFKPKDLSDLFYPSARMGITEAAASLSASFRGDGAGSFQVDFKASSPELSFDYDHKPFGLKDLKLEGRIEKSPEKLELSIVDLDVVSPRLKISGDLSQDAVSRMLSLDLKGSDLEVAPVRKMVLGLFGANKHVAKIFQIVKGGWTPHITFSAHGATFRDLGKLENFILRGNMIQGEIFVPAAELDLVETEGSVTIIQGVLDGKNLKARTGSSTAENGLLTIGLDRDASDDAPFHLDLQLSADLSQLPPVLERVVKNSDFRRELALIKDVKGRAVGRLVLGERLKEVKTRVEAREFALQGSYERLPYPVELKGELFLYEGKHIEAPVVAGKVGRSSLPRFSIVLDWSPESYVKVLSTTPGTLSIDEIYPWAQSFERFKDDLENFDSIKGTLITRSLDVEGPLLGPEKLRIGMEGAVENATVRSKRLPDLVTIKSGGVAASREFISLLKCQAALLDANFLLSGNIYFGKKAADLTLGGEAGPQADQAIADFIRLPPSFRPRAPFSSAASRLIWRGSSDIQYSGDIKLPNGPQLFVRVSRSRSDLVLEELSIKDQRSNASLAIKIKEKEPEVSFRGSLSSESLDDLLAENRFLRGTVAGDFRARLSTERPLESSIVGALELEGFQIPRKSGAPIDVEKAAIEGDGDKLFIKSATARLGPNRIGLAGIVQAVRDALRVDVEISSENLDWNELSASSKEERSGRTPDGEAGPPEEKSKAPDNGWRRIDFMGIPIEGLVRVKADAFVLERREWRPFRAAVTLRKNETLVELFEAGLCGVSTTGSIAFGQKGVELRIDPSARGAALDAALGCLFEKAGLIDGVFDLNGEIKGNDRGRSIEESLHGRMELNAREGRIYKFGFISKVFGLINFTEIYKGQIPDLLNDGCAYDEIRAKARIEEGKLILEEAVVDGHCMKMLWSGDVDLVKRKVDLIVVVAPLRTVDSIIGRIPVVGGMLNGTLISFPVRVSGDLADPEVRPLSPSAIGSELMDFIKRTLKSPLKLFQAKE